MDQLTKKVSQLTVSDPTQVPEQTDFDSKIYGTQSPFPFGLRNTAVTYRDHNPDTSSRYNSATHPSTFPLGFSNSMSTFQDQLWNQVGPMRRISLIGAQEGLVLTITPQDCLVHWPGSTPKRRHSQLTSLAWVLPYQEGGPICEEVPTKIVDNIGMAKSDADRDINASRVVFMVRRPRSPLIRPEAPDVRSSDESESNMSPDNLGDTDEAESQRQAMMKRNKLKEGHKNRARQ